VLRMSTDEAGLGKLDHVLSVTVNRPNGETEVILAPPVNQKLSIR
jgi:hypothetical protein